MCPKMCHPLWSNGRTVSRSMSSCAVRWESGVPKCITLYDQMGEQCPKLCHPVQPDGRAMSQSVSAFMIKWENSVPKYVILCSPMGERCPKVYHPLRSNGRAVVLCHDRTLTHCTCLKCFCRFISCFVSWKNRHNLRFNVNLFMLSITCSHHTFALVSALFWILYFQA